MAGYGAGAAEGLQDVLTRLFLEQRQRAAEQLAQQRLAEDARQADMRNQVEQGQLGLGRERLTTDQSQFDQTMGFRRDRANVEDQRYADEAPARTADLQYKGALTGKLLREPELAQQDYDRTLNRDRILHGYRMAEATARPRDERLVQVMGPDGQPTWVRESQAIGQPAAQAARAVTGQERGVLAFYNRAKDANDTITSADQSGRSLEDRVSQSGLVGQLGLQYAPNIMQSPDQQAYRQAQRAFTEARLRKESGAAIPTAEYENDAKTYFAQPGDTPEVIAQKRAKRQVVLDGLKFSSGRAYDEFYGQPGSGETKEQRMQRLLQMSGGK